MDSYLLSIIDLYLKNEDNNHKANLTIEKQNENIYFSFGMTESVDTTKFYLPIEVVNLCLEKALLSYKKDTIIIDEKYDYDKEKDTCYYYVLFNNGRDISFTNFNLKETNLIRNYIYSIKIKQDEIRVNVNQESIKKFNFQYAGFISLKTIFFITIFFLDIFVVSLWICKLFLK